MKFYFLLFKELIFSPYLYLLNCYKRSFGKPKCMLELAKRPPANNSMISVCIHEWGGYNSEREKKLKVAEEFTCGLRFQLDRYNNYQGNKKLNTILTLSDAWRLDEKPKHVQIIPVSNDGMDFSGYSSFFDTIKDDVDHYIILSNTSVNKDQRPFIDGYVDYMEKQPNIGMLGISYSTKTYQSIIRNNFTPHIQSFFMLTTIGVLKQIVELNKGFPGSGITDKRLLIRKGEVQMSTCALKLGYEIGVVLEDGKVFKFDKSFLSDNGKSKWILPFGDYRAVVKKPNAINAICP